MRPPPLEFAKINVDLFNWLEELWRYVELCSCKIATGTYTGDGETTKAITGVGFKPKYIRIWNTPAAEAEAICCIKVDETWGDYAIGEDLDSFSILDNRINSFDTDGFTVDDDGADAHPNTDGQAYTYLCLG